MLIQRYRTFLRQVEINLRSKLNKHYRNRARPRRRPRPDSNRAYHSFVFRVRGRERGRGRFLWKLPPMKFKYIIKVFVVARYLCIEMNIFIRILIAAGLAFRGFP